MSRNYGARRVSVTREIEMMVPIIANYGNVSIYYVSYHGVSYIPVRIR
jgi:hypothetical protein